MSTFRRGSSNPAAIIGYCVDVLDMLPDGTPEVRLAQDELSSAESLAEEYGSSDGTPTGNALSLRSRAQAAVAVHRILVIVAAVLYKRFQNEGHYEYGCSALVAIASAQASILLAGRLPDSEQSAPAPLALESTSIELQRVADESMTDIERASRDTAGLLASVVVCASEIFDALVTTSASGPPAGSMENATKVLSRAALATEGGERILGAAEGMLWAVALCAGAFEQFVGNEELGHPDIALMLRQLI